jgi:hypothetical protein
MEREQHRDEFIRKIVGRQTPDKAPEGFTVKVMDKLQPDSAPVHEHILSPTAWIGIFAGIAALIITMFFVDLPFLSNFFSSTGIQKLSLDVFNGNFYESFIRFFKEMNINAIGIAIAIGFISLVFLERIISRRKAQHGLILL